jgi:hypothetical protein
MKRMLKLSGLLHERLGDPQEFPMKLTPDYDALYERMVGNDGWTILRTDSSQDRQTVTGSTDAPMVKAFNCHVRHVRKQSLYTRRLAVNAWYLELGDKPSKNKDD